MGFLSTVIKSLTGSDSRRRARDQADAQLAILNQQEKAQDQQMAFTKKTADRDLERQRAAGTRDVAALEAAQALSLRAKGIAGDDEDGYIKRRQGGGTNSAGII